MGVEGVVLFLLLLMQLRLHIKGISCDRLSHFVERRRKCSDSIVKLDGPFMTSTDFVGGGKD